MFLEGDIVLYPNYTKGIGREYLRMEVIYFREGIAILRGTGSRHRGVIRKLGESKLCDALGEWSLLSSGIKDVSHLNAVREWILPDGEIVTRATYGHFWEWSIDGQSVPVATVVHLLSNYN